MHTREPGRMAWRISSHSGNGGGCVEVKSSRAGVLVRDSKSRDSGTLVLDRAGWRALLSAVR